MENNESKKINYFKKIWYSIGKLSKYNDMRKEGIGTSIKYFIFTVAILCLIMSIVSIIVQRDTINTDIIQTIQNGSNHSYIYLFIIVFLSLYISFYILLSVLYIIYMLLIGLVVWIVSKIYKINWTLKDSLVYTIYGSTFSMIICSICFNFTRAFVDIPNIIFICLYVYTLLFKEKNELKIEKTNNKKEN